MTRLDPQLERFAPYAYALLRIVSGVLFFFHGAQKLFGWVTTKASPELGSQLWFGGLIEVVGGTLIALGLFTRPAALIASGTMAVAYFQFHWKLVFADWHFLPIVNRGELAVVYCFLFLYIALRGPGPWAFDHRFFRRP